MELGNFLRRFLRRGVFSRAARFGDREDRTKPESSLWSLFFARGSSAGGAGANGNDEVGCGDGADILDGVFVIGADEADRARAYAGAFAFDGDLYGAFADQPHFGVDVAVWRMRHGAGRKRCFVDFEGFRSGEVALEHAA